MVTLYHSATGYTTLDHFNSAARQIQLTNHSFKKNQLSLKQNHK